MSFWNFFKKFSKEKKSGSSTETQEIQMFIENQRKEIESIEKFLNKLSPYQNPETLNMTLEEFIKYLENQAKPMQENMVKEKDSLKIKELYEKLADIDLIKSFIYTYISYSRSELYDLQEITEKTTLSSFISILKERKNKIKEILSLNIK